jgi:hypothetical protein
MILGLSNRAGTEKSPNLTLEMGDQLVVELDGTSALDASKWVLYLSGQAMPDLSGSAVTSEAPRGLVFRLRRTDMNKAAWNGILGSPTGARKVEVSIAKNEKDAIRLIGTGATAVFQLNVLWTWWLFFAFVIAAAVMFVVGLGAIQTAMLRDNLLPQIPWKQRTYSLGRCQMALWFTLVIVSFLFLWALLWDYNTVTSQALILMGIAAATGLGALAANKTNNDPVTKANQDLCSANFNSPEDIEAVLNELKSKRDQAAKLRDAGSPANRVLDSDIKKLEDRKTAFYRVAKDYISTTYDPDKDNYNQTKIFNDLITDKDGPAVHRLQVVGWTLALGLVFLVGVYRDLSMPEFSATLLALMAVSGASYVGFKFPEQT